MAELLLKVGDSVNPNGFKDGDILHAMNRQDIRRCYAERICHVREVPFNSDGLNPLDTLPYHLYLNTKEFLFERISSTEVRRTNLFTTEVTILSAELNENLEAIDVNAHLVHHLQHAEHGVFGEKGSEVWFGGSSDMSNEKLDRVWRKIEEVTHNREVDFTLFPWEPHIKKNFLALPVDDFDTETKILLESPITDVNGYEIAKRKHSVTYTILLDPQIVADVLNKTVEVDVREEIAVLRIDSVVLDKEAVK